MEGTDRAGAGSGGGLANVLLVSIDSLRADHADGAGGSLATGPRLRALARGGVVFTQATSAAPWTTPSMTTVLTGLLPWSHHVRDHDFSLDSSVPLLSQRLKALGYATGALVPSVTLSEDYGFARGFDFYLNGHYGHDEVTGPAMTGQTLAWLEKQGSRPFFCWIHFWDPHFNYLPPPPYDTAFPSGFRPLPGTRYQLAELKNRESPLRPEEVGFLLSQYDGEILHTDRCLGELLDFIEQHGLKEKTLVVLLGDHGEGFQEHGWLTHTMRVYEEMVHVPLVLNWPGHLPAGLRIGRPVSLVDVAPTILDLIGGRPRNGEEAMEGLSLLPSIRESDPVRARAIVSETVRQGAYASWRDGDWKYILDFESCAGELYDLASDPGERRNLTASVPGRSASMRAALLGFYRNRPLARKIPIVKLGEEDPQRMQLLRSLGYVETDRFGDRIPSTLKTDPTGCR